MDTGATTNVISWREFSKLKDIKLKKNTGDTLRCANNSLLETRGKAELEVTINHDCRRVVFTIVNQMTPEVIGGIDLQRQFGIQLGWTISEEKEENQDQICNIEARFGQTISDTERAKTAEKIMKITNEKLLKIIERNKNVFMANDWDIGCTTLVKHTIETS